MISIGLFGLLKLSLSKCTKLPVIDEIPSGL